MATGPCPLRSVLSLSTKAMRSRDRETRPRPRPEGKNLTDSPCSGDCGDPGSGGCWRSGVAGEKRDTVTTSRGPRSDHSGENTCPQRRLRATLDSCPSQKGRD